MPGKSNKIRPMADLGAAGRAADGELALDLLKALAVGLIGGVTAIAGAKKAGEGLEALQEKWDQMSLEEQERYRKAVEEATANEIETGYELDTEYALDKSEEEL